MTLHRHLLVFCSALALAACEGGITPVDSKEILKGMDGPKVEGVADALQSAATQAEQAGNFKLAAQTYEQMLERKPGDVPLMLAVADSLRRDGKSQRAISMYDSVLTKDAANVAAKEGKALAMIAVGDFDTPVAILDEVMAADPTRWKTLNALGILFTTRGMQPEAQRYFEEALKQKPGSASIMNNLGLSMALEKNYNGAIDTLGQASALAVAGSTERKRIDLNAALVFASAGRLEDASHLAEQYLSGAELNNNLGLYAHLAKDDQLAKAYLNKALSDSKVYYAKAWENLEELNKNSKSTKPAKKTAEKKPEAKPAEKPAEKPVEKKAEEKPAEKPVEKPAQKKAEEVPAAPVELEPAKPAPAAMVGASESAPAPAAPAAPEPAAPAPAPAPAESAPAAPAAAEAQAVAPMMAPPVTLPTETPEPGVAPAAPPAPPAPARKAQ